MRRVSPSLLCAFLGVLTLAVYAQVGDFDFVQYDDQRYVTENPWVDPPFTEEGVRWAFTNRRNGNWQPLTYLSHMLDVALFGQWAGGHHWMNVVLHAVNVMLLFGLLRMATGAFYRCALVAAVFALHPLHVESVAWISERKDVLSTALGLLSTWAWILYTRERHPIHYVASFVLLALGLATKAMLVTLPCVFLLLDYWPLRRRFGARVVVEKLPLFALCALFTLLSIDSQASFGSLEDAATLGLFERSANAVVSLVVYGWQALWPAGLSILYPHPYLPETGGTGLHAWQIVGAAGLVLALSVAAACARRWRYLAVGWLWFVGMLVPVLGFVQMGVQAHADRYMYLPLVGLSIALVWGGRDVVRALARGSLQRLRMLERGAAVASAVVLCGYASLTWQQTRHWSDTHALFRRALDQHPESPMLHVAVGQALAESGDLASAEPHFRQALALAPGIVEAHTNLAHLLMAQGRPDLAVPHYREALASDPADRFETLNNLANALTATGQVDEALTHYRAALDLAPASADSHFNLGNALILARRHAAAARHFRSAIRARPTFAEAHFNLGLVLATEGRPESAIPALERALEIRPDYERARRALVALRAE